MPLGSVKTHIRKALGKFCARDWRARTRRTKHEAASETARPAPIPRIEHVHGRIRPATRAERNVATTADASSDELMESMLLATRPDRAGRATKAALQARIIERVQRGEVPEEIHYQNTVTIRSTSGEGASLRPGCI